MKTCKNDSGRHPDRQPLPACSRPGLARPGLARPGLARPSPPWALLLALLVLAAFSGCAGKGIGYGLVLWAEEEGALATGQVLRIRQESQIDKTYLVRLEGSKEFIEIPTWRVELFANRELAQKAAEAYAELLNTFAYSQRDGLPLREQAAQEARRVYKLAEGQLVKVLSRAAVKEKVGNYEDYWYLVLTEDGYRGYCFGYFLPVFEGAGDLKEQVEKLMARDPMLEALLSKSWRPDYFQEMLKKGRIDLSSFGPQIGFFPEPAEQRLRLVTAKRSLSYRYESVENLGSNRYLFRGPAIDGASLRVNMQSKERLVLSYTLADQVLSAVYIDFQEDIEELVAGERQRREDLFKSFTSRGRLLTSTAYGNIRLQEGLRFTWEDFGRLADQILLKKVQGSGVVDFPYYLSSALAGSYDGVITFRFKEYGPEEGTSFLYTFASSGVRFEYIRPENIVNLEAVRQGISSLLIYFSFGGS